MRISGVLTSPTVRDRSAHDMSPTQARREQRKRPSTASAVYFLQPKTGTREGSGPQPFAAVRRRNQSLQSFSARPTDLVELTRPMRCNTGAIAACGGWPIVDASLCVDLHTWGKHGRLIPYRQSHRDSSSATIPHDGIPKREPSDANSVPEQFRVGDVPQEPH